MTKDDPPHGFRSDILGLRAIAIIPVILYHAYPAIAPGGFVGVDVFFVISGYLITRIIVRDLATGEFTVAGFYARRVRRLFPALFAMVAITALAGVVILPPDDLAQLGRTIVATALFASNAIFAATLNYFNPASLSHPLLHTWSLAIEEQFYLAYPVFLALAARFWVRGIPWLLWAGFAISLAICLALAPEHPTLVFYLPFARAFELIAGALVAIRAVRTVPERWTDALSMIGLAMIGVAIFALNPETPFPSVATLLPVVGAAFVIYSGEGRITTAGRILSAKPFLFFGAISYSLYLWHWPVLSYLAFLELRALSAPMAAAALGASVTFAMISWRYLEQPGLRAWPTTRQALIAGLCAIVATTAIGGVLIVTRGFPSRFSIEEKALLSAKLDRSSEYDHCMAGFDTPIPYSKSCVVGAPVRPDIAVWGDSFASELAVQIGHRASRVGRSSLVLAAAACPPALHFRNRYVVHCEERNSEALSSLIYDSRIQTVVLVALYSNTGGRAAPLLAGLGRSIEALRKSGKRVIVIYPVPMMPFDTPKGLALSLARSGTAQNFGIQRSEFVREASVFFTELDRIVRRTGAVAFRPDLRLCSGDFCPGHLPNVGPLYYDTVHLSSKGTNWLLDGPDGLAELLSLP